jgi:HAD superfamily phosphatase
VTRDLLIFDVDGVLVDAEDSFTATIVATVRQFSGRTVSRARIHEYKLAGGWNNDWALTHRLLADLGCDVPYAAVAAACERLYFDGGLAGRERWLPAPGLLPRLAARYAFALFTGRLRRELQPTLDRFASGIRFAPHICAEDVARGKPDPEGLRLILAAWPAPDSTGLGLQGAPARSSVKRVAGRSPAGSRANQCRCWFVGDTVDDARAARAAGVTFIGVVAPHHPHRARLRRSLEQERAAALLDDVNQLEREGILS